MSSMNPFRSSDKKYGMTGYLLCEINGPNVPTLSLSPASNLDDTLAISRYNLRIKACDRAKGLINNLVPFSKKIASGEPITNADVVAIKALANEFNTATKNSARNGISTTDSGFSDVIKVKLKESLIKGGWIMAGSSYWKLSGIKGKIIDATENSGVRFNAGVNYLKEDIDIEDSDKKEIRKFNSSIDDFLSKKIGFVDDISGSFKF